MGGPKEFLSDLEGFLVVFKGFYGALLITIGVCYVIIDKAKVWMGVIVSLLEDLEGFK